jgi:hypothetical protein
MTAAEPARWMWVPSAGCVCLDDDHELRWAISPDGELWPVVLDRRVTETTYLALGVDHATRAAPHEAYGPLTHEWAWKVRTAPVLCGRPTKTTGRPCRATAVRPGAPCNQHADL